VRLQLFTVPGQVYYDATRKLVLTGVDAVVFVADSQRLRLEANLECLDNLRVNLREHGRELEALPHVFQYNKRDLPEVAPIEELERELNRHGAPAFPTVATTGEGIFEALEAIVRLTLRDFEHARRKTYARGPRAHGDGAASRRPCGAWQARSTHNRAGAASDPGAAGARARATLARAR
jgi:GTPase SAR1 family protein